MMLSYHLLNKINRTMLYRVLAVLIVLAGSAFIAMATPSGITGRTRTGCGGCHGTGTPDGSTTVTCTSGSGSFTVLTGSTTTFTLKVANSTQLYGGCNIGVKTTPTGNVNGGTLAIVASDLKVASGELTQTAMKSLSGGFVTFDFTWTAPTTAGTYYLVAAGDAGPGDASGDGWNFLSSQPVSITVDAPAGSVSLTAPASGATLCTGVSSNITWTSSGITNMKIELSADGGGSFPTVIAASTDAAAGTYSWAVPSSLTAGTNYKIRLSDVANAATNSVSAAFSVSSAPTITTSPSAVAGCIGSPASFTVAASGTGLTYQWRKNAVDISGATSAIYNIASIIAGDAGSYDCVVTNGCGNVTSNPAALTIATVTSITTQPEAATTCLGNTESFTVVAAGSNLTYQWQKGSTNISGATSNIYTIASVTATDAGLYSCVVTGACGNATSTGALLTISNQPAITTQPLSKTACSGTSVSFTVVATGKDSTFQWRKNGTIISGATNATYTIASPTLADSGSYSVIVSGTCTPPVTSNNAILTVGSTPTITTHPTTQDVNIGGNVTLTVAATGSGLTYQWQKNNAAITGKTTASLTLTNVQLADSGSYNCKVTNTCGNVTSNNAILKVVSSQGPVLTLSVSSTDFGLVKVGTQRDTVITGLIKNTGSAALTVTAVNLTGADASSFAITGLTLPFTLPVNDVKAVNFSFKPLTRGTKTSPVTFTSNASNTPSFSLTGNGGIISVTSSDNSLTIKATAINTPVDKTVTLTNVGDFDATVSSAITGSQASSFAVKSPTGSFTIAKNGTQAVTVTYTAANIQNATAELDLTITGLTDVLKVALNGEVSTSVQDNIISNINSLNIYPNPSADNFNVSFQLNQPVMMDVSVFDIYGKEIKTFESRVFESGSHTISWDGYNDAGLKCASGEYMLIFRSANKHSIYPMIIAR